MPRASWIRLLVHGLGAGALLSALRVPLGLDWTQIPAVSATTAGLYRAAALLSLSLSLDPSRKAFRGGLGSPWLLAVALGYALHGFASPGWLEPATRAGAVLLLVVFTLVLRAVAGRRTTPTGGPVPEVLGRSERLGLVLVGLGTALAIETLAREVRLFAPGGHDAETVTGATFLFLCAAAAVSFGPLVVKLRSERVRTSAGLALSGASVLFGLWFVAQLTPDGLYGYFKRFDALSGWMRGLDARLGDPLGLSSMPALDGTTIGTLWTTALLAAGSFVVPAFVLGGTLGSAVHAGRVSYAFVGAAAGFVAQPWWIDSLARPIAGADLEHTAWSWTLLAGAVIVSGLGLLVASVLAPTARSRILGSAIALLVVLLPWARPHLVQWSFSPWSAYSIVPELVVPTPEGLVTVERTPDGSAIVTLDRRRLTPIVEEREFDERRLALAWSLIPEEKRRGTVRALFVGQLTPERSRFLAGLGTIELERTAPWHAALPAVEALLFQGGAPPLGALVSPAAAREKLADGEYDWVVVPPVRGPVLLWKSQARSLWGSAETPALAHLDVGDDTLGVAWVLADSAAARLVPAERVVLAQSRFESLSIGVLRGRAGSTSLPLFPTGAAEREPSRLDVLRTLPHLRQFPLEAAFARRIGRAAEQDRLAPLARGLALHYAAQVFSSPYETRAQQVEIGEDALRAFAEWTATLEPPPDDFTRELWEALAQLLTEKRMPEEMLVYVEPVAERFAPWPELDRGVGHAYREVLEPESALAAYERVLSVYGDDVWTLAECAACAEDLGDATRARGYLERGLSVQPGNPALERALGLLLHRNGEPGGRELLERALARNPEDEEVQRALQGADTTVGDGGPPGDAPR